MVGITKDRFDGLAMSQSGSLQTYLNDPKHINVDVHLFSIRLQMMTIQYNSLIQLDSYSSQV